MTGKRHLTINTDCVIIGYCTLTLASRKELLSVNCKPAQTFLQQLNAPVSFHGLAITSIMALLFYVGTLLPDIDTPESMICRKLHFYLPVKHRTWTHTIWAVVILGLSALVWKPLWALWLGYTLHLFWDSFSVSGCQWIYPIKTKHFVKLYQTSGFSEWLLCLLVSCVAAGLCACVLVG